LKNLGLSSEVAKRGLEAIRSFYREYQKRGEIGSDDFGEMVFQVSGVCYGVMTNIPFS
jgi:hypothetical protein